VLVGLGGLPQDLDALVAELVDGAVVKQTIAVATEHEVQPDHIDRELDDLLFGVLTKGGPRRPRLLAAAGPSLLPGGWLFPSAPPAPDPVVQNGQGDGSISYCWPTPCFVSTDEHIRQLRHVESVMNMKIWLVSSRWPSL
jgi:hypothetical protein